VSAPLVVVTREEGREGALSDRLAALGASVWPLPCTATAAPVDPEPLDTALAALADFDWLVVTSARTVEALLERPGWPAAWTVAARPRVAAVGHATAARLRDAGVPVACEGRGGGATLAQALLDSGAGLRGARVLWPRSDRARPELGQALRAAGALLSDPVAYRTRAARPDDLERFLAALDAGRIAAVTFASPSAASGLAELLPGRDLARLRGRTLVASIGPATSAALAERGAPAAVQASRPDAEALAEAVIGSLRVQTGVAS
jgi:uroporphyrinogen III methyltransferase/synthase